MNKKTGTKPRRQRAAPPPALAIACPTCGVAAQKPCIVLADSRALTDGPRKRALETYLKTNVAAVSDIVAPILHGSRMAAFERIAPKPKRGPKKPG